MIRFYVEAQKCLYGFLGLILLNLPLLAHAECKVTLKWTDNGGQPIGYRLFERETSEGYNENHYYDVGAENACTVYGLEENATYHFVVRAYTSDSESENSNEATYICTKGSASSDEYPPATPALVSPADTTQSVGLEPVLTTSDFDDPEPDDNHAQTRWQIFRVGTGDAEDECIYDVVSNSDLTSLKVPEAILEPDNAYYWTASHYSENGGVSEPAPMSDFTTTTDSTSASLGGSDSLGGGGGGSSDGFFGVGCFIQALLGR